MLQNKPSHWAEVPIGEILKYLDEKVVFDDMAEYITITVKRRHGGLEAREKLFGHEIKTKKQYRLHRGAFIISRVQCWHAAYAIVPDDIPENMIASQNYDQFEISPKVDRRFFWWLSHSPQFIETVRSSASGVVIEKLVFNRDAWLQKTIPIPPLDEQRQIVAHIESLAARVNEAQSLREEADIETQAYINSALNHLLVAKEHWTTKAIADVSTMSTGTTPPSQRIDYYGGDMQWYTPGDLSFEKELGKSTRTVSDIAIKENKVRIFQPGTILLVAIGGTLGKVSLARTPCSSNQQITGILFNEDIFPDYGFWWMRRLYHDLRNAAPQATLPIINQRRIGEFEISYPSYDEQRRISEYLDDLQSKINSLRNLQSETEKELNAILPSVLDKAFKGEL